MLVVDGHGPVQDHSLQVEEDLVVAVEPGRGQAAIAYLSRFREDGALVVVLFSKELGARQNLLEEERRRRFDRARHVDDGAFEKVRRQDRGGHVRRQEDQPQAGETREARAEIAQQQVRVAVASVHFVDDQVRHSGQDALVLD